MKEYNINLTDTSVNLDGKLIGATLDHLDALCRALRLLPNLQELSLAHNVLTALPETLFSEGNLPNLQTLCLSYNQLTALPGALFSEGNLPNLQELYLIYNQLTALPESLGNLPNLQQLYLNYNQLTKPNQNPVVVALKKRGCIVLV